MVKLSEKKVLFLDIQTSGGSPKLHSIVEIAWAIGDSVSGFRTESSFVALRDDDRLSSRVTRMTGISAEDLSDSPKLKTILAKIREDVKAQFEDDEAVATVIHYAQFENSFLSQHDLGFQCDVLCTHKLSGRIWPDLPSKSLRAVSGYLGFESDELKRSTHHIEASIHIWNELAKEIDSWQAAKELLKQKVVKGEKKEFLIERSLRLSLPESPGVYKYLSKQASVLYVGKATSLKARVNSYFRGRKTKGSRLNELLSRAVSIDYIQTETPLEAAILEQRLIKELDPAYNRALRQANREIRFYNRELEEVKSGHYSFGPYSSGMRMRNFKSLLNSIEGHDYDYWKRFGDLDTEMIKRAITEWKSYFEFDNIFEVFPSIAIRLYRDRVEYWREKLEMEDLTEDSEEEDEEENLEIDQLDEEDIVIHIDRVFASTYLAEKRSRKLRHLSNCTFLWKESKKQKGFHGLRLNQGQMEKFFVERRPRSFDYESETRQDFIKSFNVGTYDEASVLNLEIQRLQRKGFEHYLYFGKEFGIERKL